MADEPAAQTGQSRGNEHREPTKRSTGTELVKSGSRIEDVTFSRPTLQPLGSTVRPSAGLSRILQAAKAINDQDPLSSLSPRLWPADGGPSGLRSPRAGGGGGFRMQGPSVTSQPENEGLPKVDATLTDLNRSINAGGSWWEAQSDWLGALIAVEGLPSQATERSGEQKSTLAKFITRIKLTFLREATTLRFRHRLALTVLCIGLFFLNALWHHRLALRLCPGHGAWVDLRASGGLQGCRAAGGMDVAVAAMHMGLTVLSVGNWVVRGRWHWWLAEALAVPRILSTFFLVPAARVLAVAGQRMGAGDVAMVACGLGLLNVVVVSGSLTARYLSVGSCFASMMAFASHAGLWEGGRVQWGPAVGAAALSVGTKLVAHAFLSAGGWASMMAVEEGSPLLWWAPLAAVETVLARATWAMRPWVHGAWYVATLGWVAVYAVGWLGLMLAMYAITVVLLSPDEVTLHPAWLLLVPVMVAALRKTAMDAIRFRDVVIANLVPDDVAEALMHTLPGEGGDAWVSNATSVAPTSHHLTVKEMPVPTANICRTSSSKERQRKDWRGSESRVNAPSRPTDDEPRVPNQASMAADMQAGDSQTSRHFLSAASPWAGVTTQTDRLRGGLSLGHSVHGSLSPLNKGLVYYKTYEDVTMVFSDVVSYTDMSSHSAPIDVLGMLHAYFSKLDAMVDSLGAYKYETVGDAYVVAVNLQRPEPQHPLVALRIAVSMVALAAQVDKADGSGKLKIRVGMHTGPVAGGVIGTRRTLLTLCGDTLNVAARMESASSPGHVRLTSTTASRLPREVQSLLYFEEIDIKGKGSMETAIVNASNSDLAKLMLKLEDRKR